MTLPPIPIPQCIVGLDPSTVAFGVCLIEFRGAERPIVRGFTVIEPPSSKKRTARLGAMLVALNGIFRELPDGTTAAIEGGFVGTNAQGSLAIAEARGIAVGLLASRGIPIEIVSPSAGKRAATGRGGASKAEVIDAIPTLCNMPNGVTHLPEDASDAAAVALAAAIAAGTWRRPDRLEVNVKRRPKRAASVDEFLKLARRRIGG